MNINHYLEKLIADENLSAEAMEEIMRACMMNALSQAQLAAFLVLMRKKGETVLELTVAARILKQFANLIDLGTHVIDIVGTGGDGKNTFNVSTISSIVTAAAGVPVAKHGNYSVSSASGSANLLSLAGIKLELSQQQLQQCVQQTNVCFLFAPYFHPTLAYVSSVRQQLGIRSFFNLLGPLINPAQVKRQVVGVFSPHWQPVLAEVLANLGSERALVINSQDGLDEVSIVAPTSVIEYYQGQFKTWEIHPQAYGFHYNNLQKVMVNSPKQSLQMIQQILAGKLGAPRDMVLLNSALALYCADHVDNLEDGIKAAKEAIDSGRAQQCFNRVIELTASMTNG